MKITRPWRTGLIALAAWTTFGLAQTLLASFMTREAYTTWDMIHSMEQFMPRVIIWAALTPLITWVDLLIRQRTTSGTARVALHLPLFLVCALLQTVIRRSTLLLMGMAPELPFYVTLYYFADVEAVRYVASLMLGRVLEAASDLAKRERRAAQLEEELAQAQIHYLDLQLQPHFLFNALGSIAELAHEAPQAAAKMVDHMMSLLRYATQRRTRQEVTLKEELAALHPYLEIQRARFPDWLDITEHVEDPAYDAMVPRMLLQPLVENAIRHGLSHRKRGGLIELCASVHDGDLVISVADNGVGLNPSSSSRGLGIGLTNIRERLSTLYHDQQSIELLSHVQGGVEVLLRIPFRLESTAESLSPADDEEATRTAELPLPESRVSNARRLMYAWLITFVGLTSLSVSYTMLRHPTDHEPLQELIMRHVVHATLWILLTPFVIYVGRKIQFTRSNLFYSIPLHVFIGIFVSFVHLWGSRILVGGMQPNLFAALFMDWVFWNLTAYGVLVGFAQRTRIESWIRERDSAAARLKAELTQARLSAVVLELKPEFLLSSLTTLRALVLEDAAKAEVLLTSLADFLRTTLESRAVPASAMRSISEQIAQSPAKAHA